MTLKRNIGWKTGVRMNRRNVLRLFPLAALFPFALGGRSRRHVYQCPMCNKGFDNMVRSRAGGGTWKIEGYRPWFRQELKDIELSAATIVRCPHCQRDLWREDFGGPRDEFCKLSDAQRSEFGIHP